MSIQKKVIAFTIGEHEIKELQYPAKDRATLFDSVK